MVTLQVGIVVKLQAPAPLPIQLTNLCPTGGVAVSATTVPWVNLAEQVPPQLMPLSLPAGVPVTVPEPPRPTDRVNCVAKFAVTAISSVTVSEQVDWNPLHAPCQPVKTPFDGGVAVSTTISCKLNGALQTLPQLKGVLLVPEMPPLTLPLPTFVTVTEGLPMLAAAMFAPM